MINIKKISSFITLGTLDLKVFSEEQASLSKRELEKAGTHLLLTNLLKTTDFELNYTPANKPYLKDRSEHISISHSHDKLAIILNEQENTGIDIELIRDKVLKIRHKFLNPTELAFANDNVEKLITIWAAKEALYKVYGLKDVSFITNLFVDSFDSNVIIGKIDCRGFKKQYKLISENLENYKMVYILNEL